MVHMLTRSARCNFGRRRFSIEARGMLAAGSNIGALIIRLGFGAPSYHNYNKEPQKWYW